MPEELTLPSDATPATTEGTTPTEGSPAEARPDWLPEKFNSPADLAKAYSELEGKLGSGTPPVTEPAGTGSVADLIAQATEVVTSGGELGEDTYSAFEKAGISKNLVDEFVSNRKAQATSYTESLYEVAGGQDGFKAMAQWAGTGISAEAREAFNTAINSGNIEMAKMAVQSLKAQHNAAVNGPSREFLIGDGLSGQGSGGYSSPEEFHKDLSDPRYKTDAAFQTAVSAKVKATPNGII